MKKEINIKDLVFNPFSKIGDEWMLVASGDTNKVNGMTASWGGFGVLWNKNVAFIVIRPQRYTKEFIDSTNVFSLNFFENNYKNTLKYFGKVSGKKEDKIKKSGLQISFFDDVPFFEESYLTMICKNLYKQDFNSLNFIVPSINELNYSNKDYHTLYFAEITNVLSNTKNSIQ